jgi:hypothetical protein
MTREQFVLAQILIAAVRSADALYCSDGKEKELYGDPKFIGPVLEKVQSECSQNQIENLIELMTRALK